MASPCVFSLEIQELNRPGNVYTVNVRWFTSIKDIKDQLHKSINCPLSRMQIYHSFSSKPLSNQATLHELGIFQSGSVLRLALIFDSTRHALIPSKDLDHDVRCDEMVRQVQLGLRCGHLPTKTDVLDCTGGVYFMKASSNNLVAVFKPMDEEQGMPNNPKGHAGSGDYGLREFLKPGEGYIRETASYLLDRGGFSKVPATTIVHCEHDVFNYARKYNGGKGMYPKLGSLQEFVRANDTFEDISPSLVSVLELQKIALLDLRLLNSDRNSSNILAIRKSSQGGEHGRKGRSGSSGSEDPSDCSGCMDEMDLDAFLWDCSAVSSSDPMRESTSRDAYSLVPIDHGYCIPDRLRIDEFDWCWFWCPQVSEPVHPDVRDYVHALDIEELLLGLTKQIPLSEDKKFLLRVTHHLLQEAVAAGLTLFDVASLIARTDGEVPSPVEVALESAEDNAQRAIEMRAGRRNSSGSPSFWRNVHDSERDGSEREGGGGGMQQQRSRRRGSPPPPRRSVHADTDAADYRPMLPPLTRSCASDANLLNIMTTTTTTHRPHPFPSIKNTLSTLRGGESAQSTLLSSDGFNSDSTLSPRSPPSDGGVLLGLKRPGAAPGDALITLQSCDSNFSRPNFAAAAAVQWKEAAAAVQWKDASPSSDRDFDVSSGFTSSAASSFESEDRGVGCFFPLSNTPSPQTLLIGGKGETTTASAAAAVPEWSDSGGTDSEAEPSQGAAAAVRRSSSRCGADSAIPAAIPATASISRVVSFGAFESPPLYSLPKAERRVARLRQEKRKVIARTSEFLSLRLSFTQEALSSMVHKEARRLERVTGQGGALA